MEYYYSRINITGSTFGVESNMSTYLQSILLTSLIGSRVGTIWNQSPRVNIPFALNKLYVELKIPWGLQES